MKFDAAKHHRRSTRLKGYDYSAPGAYFVTICARDRECLFGEVVAAEMRLNTCGQAAVECWAAIPAHLPAVEVDAFVVMPNHVHGIIVIRDVGVGRGAGRSIQLPAPRPQAWENAPKTNAPTGDAPTTNGRSTSPFSVISPPRNSLGVIVRTYKAAVTTAARAAGYGTFGWQRNYYDHILRNMRALDAVREYIHNNPLRWALDRDNLQNVRGLPPPQTGEGYWEDVASAGR